MNYKSKINYEPKKTTLLQKCNRPIKMIRTTSGKLMPAKYNADIPESEYAFDAVLKKRRYLTPEEFDIKPENTKQNQYIKIKTKKL